jgi:hypothetical protein
MKIAWSLRSFHAIFTPIRFAERAAPVKQNVRLTPSARGLIMIVYHYCSVETMFKILLNSEVWLFNNRKMNDYSEGRWIETVINQVMVDENLKNDSRFEKLWQQYFMNNYPIYISCYSEDGDSLSQWRAYSSDATGVAIGFEMDLTGISNQVPLPNAAPDGKLSTGWVKVEYNHEIQTKMVSGILNEWLTVDQNKDDGNQLIFFSSALKKLSMFYKNPGFIEEKEWRLINTPVILEKDQELMLFGNISEINYMATESTIKSYFKYKFDHKLIKEIIIGSKCKLDPFDFGNFLLSNNYKNISIIPSRITYI